MGCLGIIKKISNISKKQHLIKQFLWEKQLIGRPLPNRKTIVVTKSGMDDERVEVRNDLIEVIQEYKDKNEDLYISGGASIYKQALPYVDELIISRIPGKHTGETYFPSFEEYDFHLEKETQLETFVLQIYKKG